MRHSIFFFIVMMLVTIPPVEAGVGEFVMDLLGREYWDGDWSIADKHGTPIKRWETSATISAWIDIIGFREESMINGTRYVNGSARDFAIIRRYAKYHTPEGCRAVSFKSRLVSVVDYQWDDGSITTEATQESIFIYEEKVCHGIPPKCKWVPRSDRLVVSYMTAAPNEFTTRIPVVYVHIKSYNRTVAPVTYIYVPIENHSSMKNVMISRVSYNGSTISRHDQVGWVMKNDRGTEYVEFVDDGKQPVWHKNDDDQSEIDHHGRYVTIFDPHFNISKLNISLHTPYETRYVTNYSTDIVTGHAKINIPILKVFLLLIGSFIVIVMILKVVKRVV